MPPIASPQGSRSTLITSLVIFVILWVTSTIFAIYYNTQLQASLVKNEQDIKKLAPVAVFNDLTNPEVATLNERARKRAPLTGIQVALADRAAEAKLITGNAAAPLDNVSAEVSKTLADAAEQLKAANVAVKLSDDNLLASVRALVSQVAAQTQEIARVQADLKAANEKVVALTNAQKGLLDEKDKVIADLNTKVAAAEASNQGYQQSKTANIAEIQAAADKAVKEAQQLASTAQNELTKVQGELKKSQDFGVKVLARLTHYRQNATRPLQQVDGTISRVPDNKIVYINLGEGQQITPGLTFEVYDQRKGLPPLTAGPNEDIDLPAGKASIEVIRILPNTAECRIIKVATGQTIVEGDLIMNLVYDVHTKYNFVVYGAFDLSGTGQFTPGEADVVRRLCTQWGGRVSDQVNVDTDFLVLGKEPAIPVLGDAPTAPEIARKERAQQELDIYQDYKSKAITLGIPIVNQNRFLYFVGYYDQAKR
jgi:multidrug efflux pump subunit AcrA (membrane-fusion protein)